MKGLKWFLHRETTAGSEPPLALVTYRMDTYMTVEHSSSGTVIQGSFAAYTDLGGIIGVGAISEVDAFFLLA